VSQSRLIRDEYSWSVEQHFSNEFLRENGIQICGFVTGTRDAKDEEKVLVCTTMDEGCLRGVDLTPEVV
jgi:hypothetical protein